MPIELINEAMWHDIVRIQSEVYFEIEPESLATLRSKWLTSPEYCFVYRKDGKIVAYLLAHSWNSQTPPALYQPLPDNCTGTFLLLHDLAVSKQVKGSGIGKEMFKRLSCVAQVAGKYEKILLVSIQDSAEFWQKNGFESVENQVLSKSYGNDAIVMQRYLSKNNTKKE